MGKLEYKQIKKHLNNMGIEYRTIEHQPVSTCEEAAEVRGVEQKTGVKALVLKTSEDKYILGLAAADRRLNLKKLARIVGTKKLKLASSQEVFKISRCTTGCIHPFGLLFKTDTYLDESVLENEYVNFSVGIHTATMFMKSSDLLKIIKPTVSNFT